MNEIRQLCITSSSPGKHLDEILALFHACPPQHLLPSLCLIGQSISCMSVDQLDLNIVNHPLFLIIRQWCERLLQLWLVNGTLNGEEHRALFYIHQLFKLLSEWLHQQDDLILDQDQDQMLRQLMSKLFVDGNFLDTLCRVIQQLIEIENENQQKTTISQLVGDDDEDENDDQRISPDDVQLQTRSSDDQVDQSEVIDVLFRCVNSLVLLFSHPCLLTNTIASKRLTACILDCLNTSLFIQLTTQFLRQNLTNEKIHIHSIFLLVTCLDYCTSTTTTSTLELIPSIRKILHVWCEIPHTNEEEASPLIVRLVRLIHRMALSNREAIIRENLCAFLAPHFENLCLTSTVIDDFVSLLVTLATTHTGRRHLRRLGYVQHILYAAKRSPQMWHPLALLINQRDLYQSSILKRLIHLLAQRTIAMFQSLATASNDTSFDSTTPSTKNQAAIAAIEWVVLFRTYFLSFTIVVEELINYTKKGNLINFLVDTLLSLQQDDDSLPKLIDVLIELLWTFSYGSSAAVQETLQKRLDLCRWLTANLNGSAPNITMASQAILSILDSSTKTLNRTTINHRSFSTVHPLICLLYSDEAHHDACLDIRDRLQTKQRYAVELVLTSSCDSLDSFIYQIDRSSLCLFCASPRMKSDNLAHFVQRYMSIQPHSIPLLAVLLEKHSELEGSWMETIPMIDISSLHHEIPRHLDQTEDQEIRLPSRASDATSSSRTNTMSPDEFRPHSRSFMTRPVPHWSPDDVSEWVEATQGNFETLQPLVMRLNGSALVHLAEILSIEPASMYHSLNDELIQRTGTSVPLTEYVALRSELQHLLVQKQNQQQRMMTTPSITPKIDSPINNTYRKKRWKKSRLCNIL